MVEAPALARRQPTVLIDPCDFVAQECDPFVEPRRSAIPHVPVGGRGRRRLFVVARRGWAVVIALGARDAFSLATADYAADNRPA
jgi:hypothetical protein